MSGLQILVDRDDDEDSGRVQLLAVYQLRRSLERVAVANSTKWSRAVALNPTPLVRDLRELIEALDRRVPQVERAGEISIARDAAALKSKALQRIAELEGDPALK